MKNGTNAAEGRGRAVGAERAGGSEVDPRDAVSLTVGGWEVLLLPSFCGTWVVRLRTPPGLFIVPPGPRSGVVRDYPDRLGALSFALSLAAWLDAHRRWPEPADCDAIEEDAGPIVRARPGEVSPLAPPDVPAAYVPPIGDQAALDALALALRASSWSRVRELADLLHARCDRGGVLSQYAAIGPLLDALADHAFDSQIPPEDAGTCSGLALSEPDNVIGVVMLAGRIARELDRLADLRCSMDESERMRIAVTIARWLMSSPDVQTVREGLNELAAKGRLAGFAWHSFVQSCAALAGREVTL